MLNLELVLNESKKEVTVRHIEPSSYLLPVA